MLSTAHRFLYVHIPKTGGNSVQDVLRRHADDQIVRLAPHHDGVERFGVQSSRYGTRKHSTLAEYRREYGAPLFDSLYRFACVRNPWDRAVSFFFSPHLGQVTWSREAFSRHIATIPPVAGYLSLPDQPSQGLADSLRNVHRVMRFESLQADFDAACRDIGLPAMELPVRNRSSRQPYREYYDAETAELVRERFHEEIESFGYAF